MKTILSCARCGKKIGERSADNALIHLNTVSVYVNTHLSLRCGYCRRVFRVRPPQIPPPLPNEKEIRDSLNLPD
jgi:DNA-directed RNA polymerase subunit RPC12/RpoP